MRQGQDVQAKFVLALKRLRLPIQRSTVTPVFIRIPNVPTLLAASFFMGW